LSLTPGRSAPFAHLRTEKTGHARGRLTRAEYSKGVVAPKPSIQAQGLVRHSQGPERRAKQIGPSRNEMAEGRTSGSGEYDYCPTQMNGNATETIQYSLWAWSSGTHGESPRSTGIRSRNPFAGKASTRKAPVVRNSYGGGVQSRNLGRAWETPFGQNKGQSSVLMGLTIDDARETILPVSHWPKHTVPTARGNLTSRNRSNGVEIPKPEAGSNLGVPCVVDRFMMPAGPCCRVLSKRPGTPTFFFLSRSHSTAFPNRDAPLLRAISPRRNNTLPRLQRRSLTLISKFFRPV